MPSRVIETPTGSEPLILPNSEIYYGGRPHSVPLPGCLGTAFLVSASFRYAIPAPSGLLLVYPLDDSEHLHQPSFLMILTLPARYAMTAPIRNMQ